jgi:subtilisin family serine protease
MRRHLATFALLTIVVAPLALGPIDAQSGRAGQSTGKFHRKGARAIPHKYIVVLNDDDMVTQTRDFASAVDRSLDVVRGTEAMVEEIYAFALRGFAARMTEQDALRLSQDPRVRFVEEDAVVEAIATQSNPPWGLDRIGQRDLPLNQSYGYTMTGAGVNAYVIDTGIRTTHTTFGGRAVSGFSAINDGRGTNDCNGHGTHVAGTIGGSQYGVAKGVRLFAVRVLSCTGSGSNSGVISGVNWVTANHISPAVANMSLGGGASSALDLAVNNSIAAGVTYAIAAGNSNTNAANSSPARVAAAITVGSSTRTDARSSFSNFGSVVDIFAPGSSILSAWSTSNTATNTISGTSMATPHVAGVVARYLQRNPNASPATARDAIVNAASPNRLSQIPAGTANRLLFWSSAQ